MLEQNQNKNQTESINNGQSRAHLTLLILILGILSIASIGILTLAMLRQMYPKVFAAPGIAKQLNYQGKLQDAGGVVVPDGTYGMQFTIYDAASGGNILWAARESDACGAPYNPAAKSTSTYKGIFSTLLGETGDCAINLDFADDTYYLGVTVGADPEMTPRKRIGAAGYAFNADLLDGLNTSNAGGANAFVPVTTGSGNLNLTRDFTVTSNEVGSQAIYGAATDTSATVNYGGYFTAAGTGFTGPFTMTAGVYGAATSNAAIANAGGYFTSAGTGANASGVVGLATATGAVQNSGGIFLAQGDTGRGVFGQSMSSAATENFGVRGNANGTGLGTAGVYGFVGGAANDIYGVRGMANNTGNYTTYGGYFISQAQTGRGVYGETVNGAAATNYGGYFKAGGETGRGVYGEAAASTGPTNYGGYFLANGATGRGVYGEASLAGPNANYGGYFTAAGGSGTGVYGAATTSGIGVYGYTPDGTGGFFKADDGILMGGTGVVGMVGTPGVGVMTATNRGVWGRSVLFDTDPNVGGDFEATSSTANNYGINASAYSGLSSVQNWGGKFTASGDTSYGVQAAATGTGVAATNYGGHFTASGGNGVGVYGTATSPTGWSGYLTGGQGAYADKAKIGPVATAPAESLDVVGNIANLASPAFNPVLKSSIATIGSNPNSIYVSGKYAYVTSSNTSTLEIYDVTNPASPQAISSVATGGGAFGVYVSGEYAYVINSSGFNNLQIFDVSDPFVPVSLGSGPLATSPNAVYVSGHYAYVSETGPNILEVVDVSNPAMPVVIGSSATISSPNDLYVYGNYAYLAEAGGPVLEVFDISDPMAPVSVGSAITSGQIFSVYVSGRYAYAVNLATNILEIFDISNPAIPVSVGSAATSANPYAVYVSGRYAYTISGAPSSILEVFDVSNVALPVKVGSASTNFAPYALFVSGRYAYTTCLSATNTLQVFDVSGLETTSAMVHSLEAGNLQVRNDITAQGELSVNGGLNVGGTGLFNDSLSVHSIGGVGGYFQADGNSATGLVGYTTNTLSTALVGYALGADSTGISAAADTLAAGLSLSRGGSFFAGTGSATIGGLVSHMMGVEGAADGGTGTNFGGVFTAGNLVGRTLAGQNNVGVAGFAEDSPGNNYGVYGATTSASGWAGYFTGGYGLYADRANVGRLPTGNDTANTVVIEGTLCVDDATANCPAGPLTAGYIYAVGTSITGIDLAENIPSVQELEAGDVVSVDFHNSQKVVKSVRTYDDTVMGVVSTKPGLLLGGTSKSNNYPIALAGRVPVKVSAENGQIKIGDKLTSGSQPGIAMKATEPGATIGIALEPFEQSGVGRVEAFINVDWSSGITNVTEIAATSPVSSGYGGVSDKLTADLDAKGFAINNISKITAVGGKWGIDEKGLLKNQVEFTRDNETIKKDIYALSSTGVEVVLSGSGKMDEGEMLVDFSQVDKDFTEIIDGSVPLKISVTPTESCGGLYVAEKYPQGFKVKELNNGTSGATFDWIVIGQRKGYETAAERQ